jgi:predicted nucleotidyltransferase
LSIQTDILSTLAYFDMFNYPLKKREVFLFLANNYENEVFEDAIFDLQNRCLIFEMGDFYSLHDNYDLLYRRKQGNKKAKELMRTADKVAAFLSKFPYVRAIGVSGSLSKDFADDQSDIDFFIITEKNRLWVARTIMHCFKKLTFLINRQHFFCMNYYIDETMLEIKEKNVYTATEVVTLIPYQGCNAFNKFYAANAWTKTFLPNNYMRVASAKEPADSILKKVTEAAFNNLAGDIADKLLMKITTKRWGSKTKKEKLNNRGIVMSMQACRHFAKPDPAFYQDKLMQLFAYSQKEIITKYENSMIPQLSKI